MAAVSNSSVSGMKTNPTGNKQDENTRYPTVEELLIQIESHLYKSIEQKASLLIAVWSCLATKQGHVRNIKKIFHVLYRESALTIFSGQWHKVSLLFKRGLSRAIIHFSQSFGHCIKGAEGLCSSLVMAAYDPWGDPVISKLLRRENVDQVLVNDFIKTEPLELLVIRVECLVNAKFEDAAIRLCRCCLRSHQRNSEDDEDTIMKNWKWTFMEWLLRLLFRKGRLNELVAEADSCSCHDGVRIIYKARISQLPDSGPLTETLINVFLVRDLLFQSSYCCTSELMSLWCDLQIQNQSSVSEIQSAAQKLLVGHASSSAQFYLFVDILWKKFGASLLPLYVEMYIRGLTSDLNYLEAARQSENKEYVIEIENHMAAVYYRLSSMFSSINKEISLECMLSAFSLDPTKERLDCIKKLTLQISKENALKLAAHSVDSCKYKNGCLYQHSPLVKKKNVVMCDQATQVGDGLCDNDCDVLTPLNNSRDQTSCNTDIQMTDLPPVLENHLADVNQVGEMVDKKEALNCDHLPNSCENISDSNQVSTCPELEKLPFLDKDTKCKENKAVLELQTEVKAQVNYCGSLDTERLKVESDNNEFKCDATPKKFACQNGEAYGSFIKEGENVECSKPDACVEIKGKCEDEKAELIPKVSENGSGEEPPLNNHVVNGNGIASDSESITSKEFTYNDSEEAKADVVEKMDVDDHVIKNCINGFVQTKDSLLLESFQDGQKEEVGKSTEAMCKTTLDDKIIVETEDSSYKILSETSEKTSTEAVNCDGVLKNNINQMNNDTVTEEPSLPLKEKEDIIVIPPLSHVVLDSKSLGISEDVLSDFVIVLESLRNKQLRSSNKWSQIKHLCEEYLVNVSNVRYSMLNTHLNGSLDSETDSVSEVSVGLNEFESHLSGDSVVADPYVDKSLVLRRFMNNDKSNEMTTYVNLSDIHCPRIPLEKLFCTELSSSHAAHKKRHKKHRNHEKNPEKVVLRKLRHGSHPEHDQIKRKKRKKRKGKRTKNHLKKHHSTHGKGTKNYLKTKKKKHKLKKKKEERTSGFISGDYCSDFSSTELMQIVKEHSHSFSKLPATSKHLHSKASSSDEPARKKRKVSFDKKQKGDKYHDKHKHLKSKSSKRKKKLTTIESCPEAANITDHTVHGKLDTVNDYSRIVQYSSVKKMESVQIRQKTVALNLSDVAKSAQGQKTDTALVDSCSNSQIEQLVQHNFGSAEDIMKMQLLMAQQQATASPSTTSARDFMSTTSNQAVLKYVCSKMTSHLLSMGQSSSDSEEHKAPLVSRSNKNFSPQTPKVQPQNLSSNIKHVIYSRAGNMPYTLTTNSSTAVAGTSLVSTTSVQDSRNLVGSVLNRAIAYPASITSPQITTFTIPVAPGSKLVTNKIVIPVSQCSSIRAGTPTAIALPDSESSTLVSSSSNAPISGVIIVKNGNTTQIISGVQPSSGVRVPLTYARSRPSPVVTRTVPKIIKHAARTLLQPTVKKPVIRTVATAPSSTSISNLKVCHDPVVATSLLSVRSPEIHTSNIPCTEATDLSVAKQLTKPGDTSEAPVDSPVPVEKPTLSSPESVEVSVERINESNDVKKISEETSKSAFSPKPTNPSPEADASEDDDLSSPRNKVSKSPPQVTEEIDVSNEKPEEEVSQNDENENKEEETPLSTPEPIAVSQADKEIESEPRKPVEMVKAVSPLHGSKKQIDIVSGKALKDDDAIRDYVSATVEKIKALTQQANENKEASIKAMSRRPDRRSPIKPMSLSASSQDKQLQPISDGDTSSGKASPKTTLQSKADATQTSEVPTRSFTSISDAVRFSLMDMDDATDSVENQVVLHAFQVSRVSSPSSPAYAESENGEDRNSASPASAVLLTAPQSSSTTELNVSRVAQRFEPSVHSQTDKFSSECQSAVSRGTSWILEDSISEAAAGRKSPDVDSCGEGKDDDKPKKKRKKKERSENEVTHKFWCQICSKGFFSAYNLRRHCRNVHKMDLPKGSSDVPFSNPTQCLSHVQQTESTSEPSSSRLSYGTVQTSSCVTPTKGAEYSIMSPSHDNKNQEYSVKSGQHVPQIQTAEFTMQTPPRITSQPSSTHVSVTPPKDFRHATPTSVAATQLSPTKQVSPVKSPSQSKFPRMPTPTQVPQMAKITPMQQQIALCGQQAALQQQRQIAQMQTPGLIQPLPSVACQAQQMQTSQCPHYQANKQIVQQRIGQLQLMHHVAQLPAAPHASHSIPKVTQSQSFKKCSSTQQASKMTETEQMQQAAQIAQSQQILANQQMQKLIQIRQNAIAASGIATQLSLTNAMQNVPGSQAKNASQCFQSQLAAARQAAVVSQIPTAQRAQGTNYSLSHEASSHQFFPPGVQPSQDQSSCPHSSFSAQTMAEFSSNAPSYPTIRLTSEANDGLEDLEQFLLENMPWSGEQPSAHLAQQAGNRPSSADSLTLTIPTQTSSTSQNRGIVSKGKASISKPKPRKPVATCSKNLLGNLGRGVKKKSSPKKIIKSSDKECTVTNPEVYLHVGLVPQPDLKTYSKDSIGTMTTFPKQPAKNTSTVGILNETDSSDSVQCINITHNPPLKNPQVGINFNIFSPVGLCTADKSTELICNPPSCKEVYERKNSFLDHSNLAATNSSNLDQSKTNLNQCQSNPLNTGSAFNPTSKSTTTVKSFCPVAVATPYGITNANPNPQDIFLGQRNSETSDSNNQSHQGESTETSSSTAHIISGISRNKDLEAFSKSHLVKNPFLGGSSNSSEKKSELLNNEQETLSRSNDNVKSSNSEQLEIFETCDAIDNEFVSELKCSKLEDCLKPDSSKSLDSQEKNDLDPLNVNNVPVSNVFMVNEQNILSSLKNKTSTDHLCTEKMDSKYFESDEDVPIMKLINKNEQSDTNSGENVLLFKLSNGIDKSESDLTHVEKDDLKLKPLDEIYQNEKSNMPDQQKQDVITVDVSPKINKNAVSNDISQKGETRKDIEQSIKECANNQGINGLVYSETIDVPKLNGIEKNNFDDNNNDNVSNDLAFAIAQEKDLKHSSNLNNYRNDITADGVFKKSVLENNFNSNRKDDDDDDHSSHENRIPNDENHLPKKIDVENFSKEGLNRIALRIRKPHDAQNKLNENDKKNQYFSPDKEENKVQPLRKNSKKKKVNHENIKKGNIIRDNKLSYNETKIQKTGLQNNVNKEKEISRSLCIITPYDSIKQNTIVEKERGKNFTLGEKEMEETRFDGVSSTRLRLRDTPKTSVKRMCPCCIDSKMPKKCRANGGGNITKIGSKLPNNLKNKSTLKNRNTTNGHNGKTRSSQRLRSRNNAVN